MGGASMLKLKCVHCSEELLEADAVWERAEATGMCPHCSHFYEESTEQQASLLATSHEVLSEARRFKFVNLIIGSSVLVAGLFAFFVLGLAGGALRFGALAVAGIGGMRVLHALLYDARREARSRLARPVDLRRLAKERSA